RGAPAEMLMLETDAPYLEPEPRSLKRNEPALLTRVLKRLCELRGWSAEEAVRITTANALDLFRMPIGDAPAARSTPHPGGTPCTRLPFPLRRRARPRRRRAAAAGPAASC